VFLSYRRDDAADAADRMADTLRDRFGAEHVFVDIDNIAPGEDFTRVIEAWIARCDALIVVIGLGWMEARNRAGGRRIDDPNDFVRLEIEAALRCGIRIFPVLLHGAQVPSHDELPESLLELRRRNAVQIDRRSWHQDIARLLAALERIQPSGSLPGAVGSEPSVGGVVGGCRIEAEIGRGGMAVVYRATELALGRTVALKVISAGLAADIGFQARFRREARAASTIDHEHVVAVHRFSVDEQPAYIVMRYVEGSNLSEILRARGRLAPGQAVDVIEQVASALDVLHTHNIVHRDVKPANILVERATSHVFLADFGLAKPLGDDELGQTVLMGTESYIAPERTRGEETKLGDIYSLGCVLRDMLAGIGSRLPRRTATNDHVDIPAGLDAVVERATQQEPLDRFPTAGDLARAAKAALRCSPRSTGYTLPAYTGVVDQPFHEVLSVDLSQRVATLCREVEVTIGDDFVRTEVDAIATRLGEPLVLAVVGDEGAGKSTLINALLRRRVLSRAYGDTTRIPTLFRFAERERFDVVMRGGARQSRSLPIGEPIQEPAGAEVENVEAIEVWLSVDLLRSLTIVVEPGVSRRDDDISAPSDGPTRIAADATVPGADALLFAVSLDGRADRDDAFDGLRQRFAAAGHASAVNAIAVLTHADLLASGGDPQAAQEQADRLHRALGPLVSTVVPVAGLLAETADTLALTDADLRGLAQLAELDHEWLERLLESTVSFCGEAAPVSPAGRERMTKLLGRHGVRSALDLAHAGPLNLVAVVRRMRELSGIAELRRQIDGLQLRADALKADAALRRLETLSWRSVELAGLRDQIDELRLHGRDMHLLELIGVFYRCVTREIELGDGMLDELEQLLTGRDARQRLGLGPEADKREMSAAAARRARTWKAYQNGGLASVQAARVADKVARSYDIIATLESDPPEGR
jgi:Protein kinase domain/TIR domain/Dynamin family